MGNESCVTFISMCASWVQGMLQVMQIFVEPRKVVINRARELGILASGKGRFKVNLRWLYSI
jgi:hypothetical protein